MPSQGGHILLATHIPDEGLAAPVLRGLPCCCVQLHWLAIQCQGEERVTGGSLQGCAEFQVLMFRNMLCAMDHMHTFDQAAKFTEAWIVLTK